MHCPIEFTREQLPIRPAFCMTINKAQGQTFKKAGIYLPEPCFGHGQLYVGMSRLGNPEGLHVMVVGGRDAQGKVCTDNVVYKEVLRDNY
jgi:ATP-dependent DNA helicase PIF1